MKTYARLDAGVLIEMMAAAIDENGNEIDIAKRFTPEFVATLVDISGQNPMPAIGWSYADGKFTAPAPLTLTSAEIAAAKVAVVQAFMDAQARTRNYDDIKTACTYADEPAVPKFQAEGQAFRSWRSLAWEKCYEILDAVNAGTQAIPTDDELIAALPALALPTS